MGSTKAEIKEYLDRLEIRGYTIRKATRNQHWKIYKRINGIECLVAAFSHTGKADLTRSILNNEAQMKEAERLIRERQAKRSRNS